MNSAFVSSVFDGFSDYFCLTFSPSIGLVAAAAKRMALIFMRIKETYSWCRFGLAVNRVSKFIRGYV